MPESITVETGLNATTTEHALVSSDGKGHDKISVRAGPNATLGTLVPQPILSSTPRDPWLPQQYKTPVDLVKSYQEAQAKITKQAQELAALKAGAALPVASPTPAVAPLAAVDGASPPAVTTPPAVSTDPLPLAPTPGTTPSAPEHVAPIDLAALSAEWAKNGGRLTPASLSRLAKVGIDERAIGQYIEAQTALAEKHTASLEQAAGGKDRLPMVLQWHATNNVPLADRYNMALATGDFQGAAICLAAMSAAYTEAVGYDAKLPIGGVEAGRIASEGPFMSQAEMVQAMDDRRYGKDPAFTRSVERRAMRYAQLKKEGKAF